MSEDSEDSIHELKNIIKKTKPTASLMHSGERNRSTFESRIKKAKADKKDADAKRHIQNNTMRKFFFFTNVIGIWIFVAVNFVVFICYARAHGFVVPEKVMITWLASVVVQIIGIKYVIARHLFPETKTHEYNHKITSAS